MEKTIRLIKQLNKATILEGMSTAPEAVEGVLRNLNLLEDSLILEPFCGEGSIALTCWAYGYKVIASGISPLSTFLTRFKYKIIHEGLVSEDTAYLLRDYIGYELPDFDVPMNTHIDGKHMPVICGNCYDTYRSSTSVAAIITSPPYVIPTEDYNYYKASCPYLEKMGREPKDVYKDAFDIRNPDNVVRMFAEFSRILVPGGFIVFFVDIESMVLLHKAVAEHREWGLGSVGEGDRYVYDGAYTEIPVYFRKVR